MKFVPLTNGGYAVVDDEEYALVSKFKWCRHDQRNGLTYVMRTTTDAPREMHRFIAGAHLGTYKGKSLQVHHVDGNGLNNCKSNLRIVIGGVHQAFHRAKKEPEDFGCEIF